MERNAYPLPRISDLGNIVVAQHKGFQRLTSDPDIRVRPKLHITLLLKHAENPGVWRKQTA